MELKTEYKGWDIEYVEHINEWRASIDEISLSSDKGLLELKKKIDFVLKRDSKFKDISAIVESRWTTSGTTYRRITITSVNDAGECWIKTDKGKREKLYKDSSIYVDNESNLSILEKMKSMRDKNAEIVKDIKALEGTLETINIPSD
jgi:hypothetical protein